MKVINLLPVALLGLLCACSDEWENTGEPRPLSVAEVSLAHTAAATPRGAIAVMYNTYQLGVMSNKTGGGNRMCNIPYTFFSRGWTSLTPVVVDQSEIEVYAYYPYHEATGLYAKLASEFQFDLAAQPYTEAEDIYINAGTEKVTYNGSAPHVSFSNMQHVYSRLRLTLKRASASSTTGRYDITNIRFANGTKGFVVEGTQNISTNRFTPTRTSVGGWDYRLDKPVSIDFGATAPVIDLLVPPQTVADGLTMTFTIDGRERVVTIAATQFDNNALAAGTQYFIELTLRDVNMNISNILGGVKLEEWINSPAWGAQDVPTDQPAAYLPYVVVPGAGLKVAKGNVFVNNIWVSYLAPDQGYYAGHNFGGDFFNFGISDPYNWGATGSDMNVHTGFCKTLLGDGWHVPTKAELEKLIAAGSVWGTYKSQAGEVAGRYFGTAKVPAFAHQDEYAFLPAAGSRDGWGNYYSGSGRYWSSDANGGNSWRFCFDQSSAGAMYSEPRNNGSRIRCVAAI